MKNLLGGITLENFKALDKMPQKAASAWSAFDGSGLVGCHYEPILYVGQQMTKNVLHWFLAAQTVVLAEPERHLVKLAIAEITKKDGDTITTDYQFVPTSLEIIF